MFVQRTLALNQVLSRTVKPRPFVITQKICGCDDTIQDIFFL